MEADEGPFYQLACLSCDKVELCSVEDMTTRLRDEGMLRREAKPQELVVAELFGAAAKLFVCEGCGKQGMSLTLSDVSDNWGEPKKCDVCACVIPAERLEIFPDTTRCVPCQESGAEPDEREAVDFCKFCGGVMTLRSPSGSGLARYKMVCSDCGR